MKVWVYLDGRQQGPFELEQLLDMPVDQNTKVWFEGLDKWYPAGMLEQMQPLFDGTLASRGKASAEGNEGDDLTVEAEVIVDIQPETTAAAAAATTRHHQQPDEPCPPTYLGWSIFLLICCCSPISLAAVIASICTSSFYGNGHLDRARKASEVAAWLVMIAIALGLIPVVLMSSLFD